MQKAMMTSDGLLKSQQIDGILVFNLKTRTNVSLQRLKDGPGVSMMSHCDFTDMPWRMVR